MGYEAGSKIWKVGFLSGYNLCIFLGILVAFITVAYHWKRQKYSWEHLQILMILIIPFAILGARFYTLIFDAGHGDSWSNFFTFAGMSIYGGVIGAVIPASIYLWFRRNSLDYRTVLTIILPTVLIGQALGRWGNFQNHEVYGQIVDGSTLNWMGSLKEHMYITDSLGTHYRQPLFFYESMLSLFGYIILVWVINDRGVLIWRPKGKSIYAKPGVTGALYMVYYGIVRLILQTFRDSSRMNTSYFGDSDISVNLVVSSIIIVLGIVLMIFLQFRFTIFKYKDTEIKFGSKKKYEMIKPQKEVRRFWVGVRLPKFKKTEESKMPKFDGWTPAKYTRTFIIWIPDKEPDKKWSKRELNKGKRNKDRA